MFGRRKQPSVSATTLDVYAATVDKILIEIGIDPQKARMKTEQGFGWNFPRGSALIEIYVSQHGNRGFLQVLAPIIH